jgi:hypothetical protein
MKMKNILNGGKLMEEERILLLNFIHPVDIHIDDTRLN